MSANRIEITSDVNISGAQQNLDRLEQLFNSTSVEEKFNIYFLKSGLQ
jgi:hypothetical protein